MLRLLEIEMCRQNEQQQKKGKTILVTSKHKSLVVFTIHELSQNLAVHVFGTALTLLLSFLKAPEIELIFALKVFSLLLAVCLSYA